MNVLGTQENNKTNRTPSRAQTATMRKIVIIVIKLTLIIVIVFSYRITFRLSTRPCLASQVLKTEMKYVQIKQQMHHDRKTRVFGIRNKTNAQKQIHLKHVWFFSARIHLKTDWTCRQSKENQRLHTASQFPQGVNSSFTHLSSMTLNKATSTNKNEIPQEHYRLWLSLSYVQCFTATSQTQHPFLKGAKNQNKTQSKMLKIHCWSF